MDKKTVIKRVKKYADTVKENFPIKKIILYGSYAKGTPREDSDIMVISLHNFPKIMQAYLFKRPHP